MGLPSFLAYSAKLRKKQGTSEVRYRIPSVEERNAID